MGGNKPETQKAYYAEWKVRNRDKYLAGQKAWRERNADRERERNYARICARFGMTLEDYEALLTQQDGVCAICGEPERMRRGSVICRLAIDHDHETGQVRGLLCQACNAALGQFGDDLGRLEKAVEYLKGWS